MFGCEPSCTHISASLRNRVFLSPSVSLGMSSEQTADKKFCVRPSKQRPFRIDPRRQTPSVRDIRLQRNLRGEVDSAFVIYATISQTIRHGTDCRSCAISGQLRRERGGRAWRIGLLRGFGASSDRCQHVIGSAQCVRSLIELLAAVTADVEHLR